MTDIAKETSSHVENNMDYSSLPPRGTIHKKVENNNKTKSPKPPKPPKAAKWNFRQLTLVVFLLLLVISPLIFYQLYGSEEAEGHRSIKTQNIEVIVPIQRESMGSEVIIAERDQESIEESVNEEPSETTNIDTNENTNRNENEQSFQHHIVAKGENLYRISLKYYSSGQYVEALAKYNGLKDPNDIFEGLVLEIPDQQVIVQ